MDVFNSYFKDLVFTRVDEKQGFVIYGAGIATGLGGGHKRYVLLFVPNHLAFKTQSQISELPWQNLQTRDLTYSYRLKNQPWLMPRDAPDVLLEVRSRNKQYSTYGSSELPFEILLLHDSKKKTIYQYNNKIMLSAAINTFNGVFNYIGEIPSLLHTAGPAAAPPPVNPPPPQNPGVLQSLNVPSIGNWFRAGGDAEYTSSVPSDTPGDLDDSYELL